MTDKNMSTFRRAVVVLITVIIVSIIYAALTHRITVLDKRQEDLSSGYAWKISFKNLSNVNVSGTATEVSKPYIVRNDTKIGNYRVNLNNPGDSVSYTFDVVNDGNLDALISAILIPKPICHGSGVNRVRDAVNVCKHIKYTLNYVGSRNGGHNLGSNIRIGDTLYKGESRKMRLTLSYDSNIKADELVSDSVWIDNLDIIILYSQCNNKCNIKG